MQKKTNKLRNEEEEMKQFELRSFVFTRSKLFSPHGQAFFLPPIVRLVHLEVATCTYPLYSVIGQSNRCFLMNCQADCQTEK